MKEGNNQILLRLIDILVFLLGLISFFPFTRSVPFFNPIWAFLLAMLILSLILVQEKKRLLYPSKLTLTIIFYIIYSTGIASISGNYSIVGRFFELSQIPVFYLAFLHNKRLNRNSKSLRIVKQLIPFIIITAILTLKQYQSSPYISRAIKTGSDEGKEIMGMGVGGYEFVYFLVILFSILIYSNSTLLFGKSKISKVILTILIITIGANVVLSGYTTALILLILTVVTRLFGRFIDFKKFSSTLLYSALLSPLLILAFGIVFEYLLSNYGNSGNIIKLQEIMTFIDSDTIGSSSQARLNVYQKSITIIKNNPIFGIIFNPLDVDWSGNIIAFGQHSQILDTAALYGIPFGFIQLYMYIKPIADRLKTRKKYNMLGIITLICFLIISIFNNLTPSIGFAVYFIFPTIDYLINKRLTDV